MSQPNNDQDFADITEQMDTLLGKTKTHMMRLNGIGQRLTQWASIEIVALKNSTMMYRQMGQEVVALAIEKRIAELIAICEEFPEAGETLAVDIIEYFQIFGAEVVDDEEDASEDH